MIYVDLRTGQPTDTAVQPFGELLGLAAFLKGHWSAREWIALNGADAVVRVVRAIRAEAFRRQHRIPRKYVAMLNHLDPPPCRCGKPGTRIRDIETFCTSCGPRTR